MVLQVITASQYDPIFIVPIFAKIHINLLHKFTKCVISPRNKTSPPPTELTAGIFFPERFAGHGFRLRDLHPSLVRSDCQHPHTCFCSIDDFPSVKGLCRIPRRAIVKGHCRIKQRAIARSAPAENIPKVRSRLKWRSIPIGYHP